MRMFPTNEGTHTTKILEFGKVQRMENLGGDKIGAYCKGS